MRRWLRRLALTRFRLRTALLVVAAMAVLSAALTRWVPHLLWRLRTERAIARKVEGDVPVYHWVYSNPSFQLFHGLNDAEMGDLRRDPGLVVDRLLRDLDDPSQKKRWRNVLHGLGLYLDGAGDVGLTRRFVGRGVALLASGRLPIDLEIELAKAVVRHAHGGRMTPDERAAFLTRARVVLRSPLPHPDFAKVWAYQVAQLGGPRAVEIIREAWHHLDSNGRSKVLEVGLPGLPPQPGAGDLLACQTGTQDVNRP